MTLELCNWFQILFFSFIQIVNMKKQTDDNVFQQQSTTDNNSNNSIPTTSNNNNIDNNNTKYHKRPSYANRNASIAQQ